MALQRWRRLLPGLWAGWLLCVALLATPAGFALLPQADAGRLAARMLAQEAYTSLALGVVMVLLERACVRRDGGAQFSWGFGLALGAIFCTVAGYFVIQPMMPAARLGQGPLSFGALHAISSAFYALKCILVMVLAWRATLSPRPSS
ncbi:MULTISPECIES: DUF4149 domain-containing protein [unclassified Rubrivivax]|uniref:DUF4149 domain-containing protein n=1 Tax=unclassified Rubrivivax TaxID=2649762 RepID=UPI0013E98EB0|nr:MULTISPECIES: DUF4149 domain-containing protein [unclassified Rubrivivax]MCC9598090.1 DUF4149 domain-containing protein [Rubrivivax sp. JA1055]MCC9645653.1 DUF4149 domain-containing protein [Rubrivivax sp. JA1029]MCD0417805.1 DUF4149 domain-containing protein [Rubrivivax sp. JA1024]